MQRLEQEAGIDLTGLRLGDIADVTTRIFELVSAHPLERRPPTDPTLAEAGKREREALLAAVEGETDGWSETDRRVAAAMFDVLWAVASYERLAVDWQLAPSQAIRGLTWVVGLLEDAVRRGDGPSGSPGSGQKDR
jgi:hypothetical protein